MTAAYIFLTCKIPGAHDWYQHTPLSTMGPGFDHSVNQGTRDEKEACD